MPNKPSFHLSFHMDDGRIVRTTHTALRGCNQRFAKLRALGWITVQDYKSGGQQDQVLYPMSRVSKCVMGLLQ